MMRNVRRGSMYVTVLASATLVAVIGLSGLALSRVARRTSEGTSETVTARAYAESAVEMALQAIAASTSWRSGFTHNAWSSEKAIGDGTYAYKLVDEKNGSLTFDTSAPVRIYGRGKCGNAVRIYSVLAEVATSAPNLLENGDFEAGTAGWSNFGSATLATSSSAPHAGTYNLLVTNRSSASAGPMQVVTDDIQSEKSYHLDLWLKSESGTANYEANLHLTLLSLITTIYPVASGTVGTSWQEISGTFNAPVLSGLYLGRLVIRTQSAKGNFSVDDAVLFEVGTESQTITAVPGTWRQEIDP